MPTTKTIVLRFLFVVAALGLFAVACQGPEAFYRPGAGEGGSVGTGGTGLVGSGGAPGTGGIVLTGTGGTTGTGGRATGGVTGTGGTPATGGTTGTGGRGTGGSPATGGTTGTGGRGTGGSPATGGTTGTGGSPATGGAGGKGTGGSPATGGSGGKGTGGSPATGQVVVDTDCQSAASPQSIGLYLDVLNTSSTAIPLSQITFRYYFQLAETTDPPHLDIDYSTTVPSAAITAKFVAISPAVKGANEYMEVGFTAAAGSLAALSNTAQIQLRLHAANYANPFDSMQTTDYSFQTCTAGRTANTAPFAQQTTITAYVGGVLVSGIEPS